MRFDTGRQRYVVLRSLITASTVLKQQPRERRPGSDIADMDDLIDELCDDFELEIMKDKVLFSLNLDPICKRQEKR